MRKEQGDSVGKETGALGASLEHEKGGTRLATYVRNVAGAA